MSDAKLRKNGGKGTFFGNLWRGVVKNNIPMGETIVEIGRASCRERV